MRLVLALLSLCFIAGRASAQRANLVVSGAAHRVMSAGFDTATVEKVFCVWWHDIDEATVSLDSAMVPRIDSADVFHVWYKRCPLKLATAHWHLLDLGAVDYRTPADSATLVEYPSPFGVLLLRKHAGDRFPVYIYYDR